MEKTGKDEEEEDLNKKVACFFNAFASMNACARYTNNRWRRMSDLVKKKKKYSCLNYLACKLYTHIRACKWYVCSCVYV